MTTGNDCFQQNLAWAEELAKRAHRSLPAAFALDDLQQEARMALWKASEKYDATTGVPFRAFAYRSIVGAMYMSVRRRNYVWSRVDELDVRMLDVRETPLELLMAREAMARQQKRNWARKHRLQLLLERMPPIDSIEMQLVRLVYVDGLTLEQAAERCAISERELPRRVATATRVLRKIRKGAK